MLLFLEFSCEVNMLILTLNIIFGDLTITSTKKHVLILHVKDRFQEVATCPFFYAYT